MDDTWGMQLRLVGLYLAAAIVVGVLVSILTAFLGGGGSAGAAATLLVAMIPGDVYFRKTGKLPSAGFSWRMALWFTLASTALGVVTVLASIRMANEPLPDPRIWSVAAVVAAITVVPTRFLFSMGAKSRKKAAERPSAPSSPTPTESEIERTRLLGLLELLEAIPAHRRVAERADERAAEVRALLSPLPPR